jgi:hypothetical protein
MVAEVGIEPDLMAAYETAVCASSSSPQQNWSTEQESNWLLRFTGAAHRQQCLVSGRWQGPILATRRYPPGASGKRT